MGIFMDGLSPLYSSSSLAVSSSLAYAASAHAHRVPSPAMPLLPLSGNSPLLNTKVFFFLNKRK